MSNFIICDGELYHHGVKGMKWGVRRYQNSDGSLTPAGKKRYAKQEVKEKRDAYRQARREYSRAFDKANTRALSRWSPSKKHREAHAERMKDVQEKAKKTEAAKKEYIDARDRNAGAVLKGQKKVAKVLNKVGRAYVKDQTYFGGIGTKVAKGVFNTAGRASITAYKMRKGDTDIRWYDKHGRRVG